MKVSQIAALVASASTGQAAPLGPPTRRARARAAGGSRRGSRGRAGSAPGQQGEQRERVLARLRPARRHHASAERQREGDDQRVRDRAQPGRRRDTPWPAAVSRAARDAERPPDLLRVEEGRRCWSSAAAGAAGWQSMHRRRRRRGCRAPAIDERRAASACGGGERGRADGEHRPLLGQHGDDEQDARRRSARPRRAASTRADGRGGGEQVLGVAASSASRTSGPAAVRTSTSGQPLSVRSRACRAARPRGRPARAGPGSALQAEGHVSCAAEQRQERGGRADQRHEAAVGRQSAAGSRGRRPP